MGSAFRLIFAAAVLAMTVQGVSAANDYPTRAVHVVVPYSAGGPSDTGARFAAEVLSRQLGQPVVVENHGGAGGLSATEAYLKENKDLDGYTILVGAIGPLSIIPGAEKVTYNPIKDFVPLGTVWRSGLLLAVRPGLGLKTVGEFVAYAKAHPGKLTIGSAGAGTIAHLAVELLKYKTKINLIVVPFRSAGDGLTALMGGHVDAMFGDTPIVAPQVKVGKIDALAVTSPTREPVLPNVPTMAEAGFPGVQAESWFGFVVSSRTPTAITKRLQQALVAGQQTPAYAASLAKIGARAGELGPESFAKLIKSDGPKWKALITAAGIKLN